MSIVLLQAYNNTDTPGFGVRIADLPNECEYIGVSINNKDWFELERDRIAPLYSKIKVFSNLISGETYTVKAKVISNNEVIETSKEFIALKNKASSKPIRRDIIEKWFPNDNEKLIVNGTEWNNKGSGSYHGYKRNN